MKICHGLVYMLVIAEMKYINNVHEENKSLGMT